MKNSNPVKTRDVDNDRDANRDPLSGAPGAHPVGVGVGAASGGAVGAAIGAVAGPVGAVVGAGIGAVVGGLGGKAVAEQFDPTVEDKYWQDNYRNRPYVTADAPYNEYQPAYLYGAESVYSYPGKQFDMVERDIERGWDTRRGSSTLPWSRAKDAVRDGWDRVSNRTY